MKTFKSLRDLFMSIVGVMGIPYFIYLHYEVTNHANLFLSGVVVTGYLFGVYRLMQLSTKLFNK